MTQPSLFDTPRFSNLPEPAVNNLHTPAAVIERRNRIRLTIAAYAYEAGGLPDVDILLMTDAEFDALALAILPQQATGHPVLDEFFRTKFDPCTGSWIWDHPELDKVKHAYARIRAQRTEAA